MKIDHKNYNKMKTLKDIQNDERSERACRIERKTGWLKLAERMEQASDYGVREVKRAYGKIVIFPDAYLAVNNDGVEMPFEKYAECLSWLCGRKIGRA